MKTSVSYLDEQNESNNTNSHSYMPPDSNQAKPLT